MKSDPNGYDWKALGYSSLEAFIENKAGACPPDDWPGSELTSMTREQWLEAKSDWPFPPKPPFAADDEDDPAPRGDAERQPLKHVTTRREGGTTRAKMADLFRADPGDGTRDD